MKTLLILVGKTNDKHFAAGINDYVERIGHYMPFDVVTIPELKNTKNLTEEQQKTTEGELILKQLQPSDTVVLLDEHGRGVCPLDGAEKEYGPPTGIRHRRAVWILACRLCSRQRAGVAVKDDLLAPDGQARFHRTGLSRVYYNKR